MDNFLKYIRSLSNLSDTSWELLQPVLTKRDFKKNELLLKQGHVCNSLFYIDNGYCKSNYEIEGVVKNTGFVFENEVATNISGASRWKSYWIKNTNSSRFYCYHH